MSNSDWRNGGWRDKYHVSKVDGTPCEDGAVYFVLRLDEDPNAKFAALAYAASVEPVNPGFARDIREKTLIGNRGSVILARPLDAEAVALKWAAARLAVKLGLTVSLGPDEQEGK